MLKPGITADLAVVREASFGYFLSDGHTDILLHQNEATKPLELEEKVRVFLYYDHQNRLSATMHEPIIKNDEMGWLKVVSVRQGHGVFVDNGISRDLFVSMDELPFDRREWPAVGDQLFCSLAWDKKGRLMGKLVKGSPVTSQAIAADRSWLNKEVEGVVYHFLDEGAALLIENGPVGFLHQDEAAEVPRLGQTVRGRIQFVRDDGRVNITQRLLRTEQQKEDADRIPAFLAERKGGMPYTDKSPPEDIKARFGMSKAAFKRALGKLIKDGKVEQRDGFTYQVDKE